MSMIFLKGTCCCSSPGLASSWWRC